MPPTSRPWSSRIGIAVTVILANRTPLKEQTGADLIYYDETYSAFVLVVHQSSVGAYRFDVTAIFVEAKGHWGVDLGSVPDDPT
ncbi:hypothetical protein ACVWXN_006977 [Bradyrhizobium sp. i1.4.4]